MKSAIYAIISLLASNHATISAICSTFQEEVFGTTTGAAIVNIGAERVVNSIRSPAHLLHYRKKILSKLAPETIIIRINSRTGK